MKKILTALYIMVVCASCTNDPATTTVERNDDQFLEESQIGAYLNDEPVKIYDQTTDQIVFTDSRNLYTISDTDYTTHITLSIIGDITLGSEIEVSYINNNIEKLGEGVATMTVVKIDATDKRYWLWNSELMLGFILDFDI